MTSPQRVQLIARRGTLILAVVGFAYLMWRFELTRLPDTGCSPLVRFSPGSPLLVDKQPQQLRAGDAVFFQGPDGRLYLGSIEEEREGGYWLAVDNEDCAGAHSETLGVIPESRIQGRILMAFASR